MLVELCVGGANGPVMWVELGVLSHVGGVRGPTWS